jgi:hypothetical protein
LIEKRRFTPQKFKRINAVKQSGGFCMDNKYGLGSSRVAHEHHDASHPHQGTACKYCGHTELTLCTTMHDHRCNHCGEWQNDVMAGYSTGRFSDY